MDTPATQALQRTRAPGSRSTGRISGVLTDIVLWIAAGLGALCIVLVVLAMTANVTLIMFRTGSMSPTIPAGSVAIVQLIPASEISVGDVVTVDRPGTLPITHRVTSVEAGSTPKERLVTLRGDANAQDDPSPHTVTSVRIVRFAIPGLAPAIAAMGNPVVLGGVTVAAAALVLWAFWPRGRRRTGVGDGEQP